MYKVLCLLILISGINCSDNGAGASDLSVASVDLGTTPPDLSMTPSDLSTTPSDLGAPIQPKLCPKDGWCWENPLTQGSGLLSVWGVDANHVWAVGDRGTIMKWDGAIWTLQQSGTTTPLIGVWGTDINHV